MMRILYAAVHWAIILFMLAAHFIVYLPGITWNKLANFFIVGSQLCYQKQCIRSRRRI